MRIVIVLLICVLPEFLFGQYTYFNKFVDQEDYNVNSNYRNQLLLVDSNLVTFGTYLSDTAYMERGHFTFDLDGNILNQQMFGMIDNEFWFGQYSESMIPIENGYLFASSFHDFDYEIDMGKVKKFDEQFNQVWEHKITHLQADTVMFSEYNVVRTNSDGSIFAVGQAGCDSLLDVIGDTHAIFLLTKLSSNGDSVWHKEYPFHADQYFQLNFRFCRTTDMLFTDDGDILVFGYWYDSGGSKPFVIRFDSEGEFIDHESWGNNSYFNYFPFAVDAGNDVFYFAYNHGDSFLGEELSYQKPRLGKLDASDGGLDIELFPVFDHLVPDCRVFDLERTPDGGFVILGEYYLYPNPEEIPSAAAYMLKCDALGNEEWYHKYYPPVEEYFTPEPYDLEITPDGGLAFAGNFEYGNTGEYVTWVVKTDACGDEEYNGCPVGVTEFQISDFRFQIAPNPASEVVSVSSDVEFESIAIRDITGKLVYTSRMNNHTLQTQIDVSMLAKGLYLIEADFGGSRVSAQRLVVE